jgi:SAM-dependent methyltransferase
MLRRKRRMVIKMTSLAKGNILDIGSGTSHFLNVMKEAGWNTTGIEINKAAREYAATQFTLKILPPEELMKLPSEEFDCITLWHVAEHLYDLNSCFYEIKRLLKPDGIALVALPNSHSSDSAYFGKYWAAYDVPRHLWHFNDKTFSDFAGKAGYEIISTHPLPLDVFYISILSEKHKNNRTALISGTIKGAYFSILSVFDRLKSSSLVFVVRRKINQ